MNTGSGMTARAIGWLLLVSGRGKSVSAHRSGAIPLSISSHSSSPQEILFSFRSATAQMILQHQGETAATAVT